MSLVAGAVALAVLMGLVAARPAQAAFPGTNGKIAFLDVTAGARIGVVNHDGTSRTLLSPLSVGGTEQFDYPAFSADGTKLAFQRIQFNPSGDVVVANTGIYVMSSSAATTTGATKIPGSDALSDPNWSPDGTKLVAVGSNGVYGDGGIIVVDVATGAQTPLTTDELDQDPAWSSTGTIAFSRQREIAVGGGGTETIRDIHTMTATGTSQISLNSTPASGDCERHPSWSPDGTKLAFTDSTAACEDGLDAPITIMSANGTGRSTLANASGAPVWSPDGTKIAFSPDAGGVHVVAADGTGTVTTITATDFVSDWQPSPAVTTPVCSITGTAGNNALVGGAGDDVICALGGHDFASGLGGNDVIFGDAGFDALSGGTGNDEIEGGTGIDVVLGGSGNDAIDTEDNQLDFVSCGPGADTLVADPGDFRSGCETVTLG